MHELLADLLLTAAYGLAALLMSGLGVLIERGGLAHLTNGESVLGLWMIAMGVVFLYVGIVMLGYEGFLARTRQLANEG